MNKLDELLKSGFVLLDGGMGTMLQKKGVAAGRYPELLNLTAPEVILDIQKSYREAGSRIIYTNTFGANRLKLAGCGHSVSELVADAVGIARKAADGQALVALDIGPIGRLLEPLGDLSFEEAYDIFRETVEAGRDADLIIIETMADLYEVKAALFAAKENSSLPVFVTMSFEESGRTYTGCTPESMARSLSAWGADAIGVNCSLGPESLKGIIGEIAEATELPVIAKPNAGLPDPETGAFTLTAESFAEAMKACIAAGATLVGGCCGTNPDFIAALRKLTAELPLPERRYIRKSFVCTPTRPVTVDTVRIIGECINPTSNKRLQQALKENDLDYILQLGIGQMDAGAEILDVNVGYPGIDEVSMLPQVVRKLQSAIDLPLQLDSSNPKALEAGLRVYNGIASVNSVNGKAESQAAILPLIKKYGTAAVALTLDDAGLPDSADKRIAIAKQIVSAAAAQGIPAENLWVDCLTLTVSAQQAQAKETLEAVRRVKTELGLKTVLGVSNISYGMPDRLQVTRCFLTEAMAMGLDLPIINPAQPEMAALVRAHNVLSGSDAGSRRYIAYYTEHSADAAANASAQAPAQELTLENAVIRGLKAEAGKLAEEALKTESELSLVEKRLIPALDKVGEAYEKGSMFLPQLLSAAQAAQAVFETIRSHILDQGGAPIRKGRLIMATVKGDIHDIGKNIVKTVLENYGYEVIDLGKDVPPETVCREAAEEGIRLVGLSALMTTTLSSMEETIRQLKALPEPPAVMVGGAVVTPEYAAKIGADFYSKDAREAAQVVRRVLG